MVNFEPVCEIERENALWIVRYSEIKSQKEFLNELKLTWIEKIEQAKKSLPLGIKITKTAISAKLGISTSTLRKRMKFLEEVK